MSFIQRLLDRIGNTLRRNPALGRYAELYAAQQALMWALEPDGFKAPYDMIRAKGTLEDLEGCPAENCQSASSDSPDHRVSSLLPRQTFPAR
jgi:hypothetical protein